MLEVVDFNLNVEAAKLTSFCNFNASPVHLTSIYSIILNFSKQGGLQASTRDVNRLQNSLVAPID